MKYKITVKDWDIHSQTEVFVDFHFDTLQEAAEFAAWAMNQYSWFGPIQQTVQ